MTLFEFALIAAVFLCSLVAGFLFAFAVVVMPGIGNLSDREFIRAFQAIDGVIQKNQPVFVAVWVGSVLTLLASMVIGIGVLDGSGKLLIVSATLAYLLGVQLPTVTINVPLNNRLQAVKIEAVEAVAQKVARREFESRWNRWNLIRTGIAGSVSGLLVILLCRL